ncbi:MAG: RagB/SusD family nutrient uptake outer membrane protein, partial [Bacteroidota bacterium]
TLRSRAGLADLGAVDLDIILNERRKELAFEGQRRMDLLRNGLNLRRPGQPQEAASAPGQNLTIFPIPQRVRDLSPFVEQNPGY